MKYRKGIFLKTVGKHHVVCISKMGKQFDSNWVSPDKDI